MRMSAKAMLAAGALVVGMSAQQSDAARFFLSLTDDGGAGPHVPVVDVGFSGTVYIMAQLDPGETIAAMGLSVHTNNPEAISVSNAAIANPNHLVVAGPRWNQTDVRAGDGTGAAVEELFGVQVGGGLRADRFVIAGILLNDPLYNAESNSTVFGSFDLNVTGTGALWLSAGARGLPVGPNGLEQGALVGFGDDHAPNNNVGPSGNPDLIVPEPASMALVGLGALAMLRRRQA